MALISEINKWHYLITWDNPVPADSSAIRAALEALGKVYELGPKTTVILAPRSQFNWRDVRRAIQNNLHKKKGNAVYANLRSSNIFGYGSHTGFSWRQEN